VQTVKTEIFIGPLSARRDDSSTAAGPRSAILAVIKLRNRNLHNQQRQPAIQIHIQIQGLWEFGDLCGKAGQVRTGQDGTGTGKQTRL